MLALPKTTQINLLLEEGVLHLTLNRPEVRNAMSADMVSEIAGAFDTLDDAGVRAVVIRGAGGHFCSGGDIKDMASLGGRGSASPLQAQNDLESIARHNAQAGMLFRKVNYAPQAVIAVLEGAVMGGGFGLACAADITIALRNARFGLPETSLGIIPAQVAPFIRQRVGESYARLLGVLGGQFDAVWAQQIGLVHYLVDNEDDLKRKLTEVLNRIKACAPQALAGAKKLLSGSISAQIDEPQQLGLLFAKTMVAEEAREGMSAFMEKRKPRWNR